MKHSKNDTILINVLTRTSNRPKGFQKCYTSIKEQTYKNIKHIVSYDNDTDLQYLNGLDIETINVSHLKRETIIQKTDLEGNVYAPYNLYCNAMLETVKYGWVLFLDDDDNLYHNRVIEEIVYKMKTNYNESNLYIWQMRYPDGRLLPTSPQIEKQVVKKNFISTPCFLFHSKYKNQARWDAYKASDFRFLSQLLNSVSKVVFFKKVMVQINNYGDLGRRNDISNSFKLKNKMPLLFYKNALWSLIPKYHTRIFGRLVFHKKTYMSFFKKLLSKY